MHGWGTAYPTAGDENSKSWLGRGSNRPYAYYIYTETISTSLNRKIACQKGPARCVPTGDIHKTIKPFIKNRKNDLSDDRPNVLKDVALMHTIRWFKKALFLSSKHAWRHLGAQQSFEQTKNSFLRASEAVKL